jgi:hypothetical protein
MGGGSLPEARRVRSSEERLSTRVQARRLSIFIAAAVLAVSGTARAAAKLWTGANNNNWSNAGNWNPAGVPGSGDDVTISGGSTTINMDAAVDVNSITVTGACTRTIRTNPGATTIRVRGDLTLSSTSSGGAFRLSSATTQIGGQLVRANANMDLESNGGVVIFNAASGNKTHTLSGATLETVIFNDGLVGYWNLDEAASPFADASGYGNTGTLNGAYASAAPPTLKFTDAGGVTFNGSTNRITLGTTNLPAANAAQTISLWAKFSGAATTQSFVAMTATGSAVKLGLGGGFVRVRKNSGTLVQVAAPSTGVWHHVAYTLSGTTHTLYIDGVATSATAAPDSAAPTAAFAGATAAGTDLLTGSLDDVRIYNRALSAVEVRTIARGYLPGTGVATHTLAGTFETTSAAGAIVIASGIVTGSGPIICRGDWLNYGGRFTGTGAVSVTGSGTRQLLSAGQPFRNLTIDASGTYTLHDRLWVSETPGAANTGVLTLAQGQSLDGGGWTIRAGRLDDQSNGHTGLLSTTDGDLVLDGSSSQNLASHNFCGLRIEDPTETGLAGYWKLDAGQGTSVRDEINDANGGTLSAGGAAWAAASTTIGFDNNAAMAFTGSSGGYVSAGATGLPAANATQTVSVWANFSSAAGATQTLVAMTGPSSAIRLVLSGGNVQVLTSGGTVLAQVAAPSAGTWHHLAYVHDPSQALAANRDKIYVDGTASTGLGATHDVATPTATFIGATSAAAAFYTGSLDDVRVYTTALSTAQIKSLSLGRYAGTGGTATVTMTGGDTTIPINAGSGCNGGQGRGLFLDSGSLYTSDLKLTVRNTSFPVQVNAGTLHIGSDIVNLDGGLIVNPMGTLLMDEAPGQLQPGVNTTVLIDGALIASNSGAIIQRDNNGQRYAFKVGSFSGATPVLDITGLAIRDIDANGMQINADPGATTTFIRFDNIVFRRGLGTYLNIYASALYLTSSGCVFGVGDGGGQLPANNVILAGNGTADGETRAIFGGATCHANKTTGGYCQDAWTSDDDPDDNGVGNTPATNGAVVQYVRGASTDTAGSIEGFPTSAFDWNTFAYYSTYVAYHDASGTADRVYVRDQAGAPRYQWDTPAGETIIGTPRWITTGTTHYLYVALASGKVYRLVDDGTSLAPDSSGNWAGANNPFNCACTIVTPLTMDTSNLYWGGTTAGPTQKVWTLGQVSRSQPMGSPFVITPALTAASPGFWTSGVTSYLFFGVVGNVIKLNVSSQALDSTNTNPGSAAIRGRVLPTVQNRVFAGDDAGTMWALDAHNFAGSNKAWSYTVPGDSIQSAPYYDYGAQVLHFGTEGGKVVALNASGTALTGYPYVPGSAGDSIRTALLYTGGILVVGTTTGKLFFLDRNNGTTGPALVKAYYFGPTQAVSGIGYDSSASRYMATTADPNVNDGRLYYFDQVADPTPGTP